ncbi:hypothetical protein H7Y63_03420, partial [Polaromonas sp.]|nr:hypothetical protein [Candidatus Saccharibacteria bacterium]
MRMTPQELLFQSFRHSQGGIGPQLRIFRYMELVHGIRVDLHPTAQDHARFVKYLDGTHASSRGHIKAVPTENKSAAATISSMKSIRFYNNSKNFGQKV